MGDADIVQMHLSQALTRVTDTDAGDLIETALTELRTPNRESITTCPWCGARGVPSRLATQDCPITPSHETDTFGDRAVSTTLDLNYTDDHATVAVTPALLGSSVADCQLGSFERLRTRSVSRMRKVSFSPPHLSQCPVVPVADVVKTSHVRWRRGESPRNSRHIRLL